MESADPVPAGDWHPFPNPGKYQKSVSNYDAFPSGHLATAMATITILAGNYPDNKYIKPVGYSLMGLLGYAMLNNGVHWISDYPLAIAIGYTCGKIAVSRRPSGDSENRTQQWSHFSPDASLFGRWKPWIELPGHFLKIITIENMEIAIVGDFRNSKTQLAIADSDRTFE